MSLGTDWGSDPYPVRQPDESFVEYQAREREWRRRHPGETRHSYDIGQSWSPSGGKPAFPAASVGMPTAFAKFPATGEQLGDFEIASPSLLPAASRPAAVISHPTPDVRLDPDDRAREGPHLWKPEAPPPSYPSPVPTTPGSPPWFFAPSGAFAPGLRAPFDLPPEEIRRRQVLEATQFDTDWGEPPSGDGLQWSTTKFVYEPTQDEAGSPYRYPAQYGIYEQAFQGGSVPIGRWGMRWVDTTRMPYRILPASERHVWDLHVQSAQRHGSEKGSRGGLLDKRTVTPPMRDFPLLGDHPVDIVLPPGYGPPPKKFNLGDYAWIAQRDLPIGCPYPYPYLPVPQEDYASGRWLAPDYVPSISLPPPYDQTPWQCGATPQAVERKKGKQGEPFRNLLGDITDTDAIALSDAARAAEAEAARKAAEAAQKAGIPTPTGTAAPDEVGAQSSKVAQLEKAANELDARISRAADSAQAAKDRVELEKIQRRLGAENAWLEHLRVVKEKQDSGEEGYASPQGPSVGLPPGVPASPQPDPPPGPGGRAPPVRRKTTPADGQDELQNLRQLLIQWHKDWTEVDAGRKRLTAARAALDDANAKLRTVNGIWNGRGLKQAYDRHMENPRKSTFTAEQKAQYESELRKYNDAVAEIEAKRDRLGAAITAETTKLEGAVEVLGASRAALSAATANDAGMGTEIPTGGPIGTIAAKFGTSTQLSSEDIRRGVSGADLRFSYSLNVGLFINDETGFGEVLEIVRRRDGSHDAYKVVGGGASGLVFDGRDYRGDMVRGPGTTPNDGTPSHGFQIVTNKGVNPPESGVVPKMWHMFEGSVDRKWASVELHRMFGAGTLWGAGTPPPDNVPKLSFYGPGHGSR
jgi:hypothetical protein